MNARSQISKSHTLILHEHWLPNRRLEPRHSACSANASTQPFSPLPDGQDSSDPAYPQGIHATGMKLNHEAMNAFRKPGVEKRLDSWTKTVLTPPELQAGPTSLAWV